MKSQSLGKHKSVSDSAKPPKSKVLRVAESNEDCTALTSGPLAPSSIMDWPSSPCHNNSWDDDLGTSFTMDVPLQDTISPHEFDPNFITGLEDLGPLLDITDVG